MFTELPPNILRMWQRALAEELMAKAGVWNLALREIELNRLELLNAQAEAHDSVFNEPLFNDEICYWTYWRCHGSCDGGRVYGDYDPTYYTRACL
ncbi:MAG: hypothetical protein GY906_01565 [bacterium]|nr:hypothetical protein [bacterium]